MKIYLYSIIVIVILTSCRYVLIPSKYYDNYSKIINEKAPDSLSLNLNNVYVVEDTFLTRDYKTKSYRYTFLYKNNLMAEINTPFIYDSKVHPVSEKDLADLINTGFFNNPANSGRIDWNYYEIKNGKLTKYILQYNPSSGINPLSHGDVIKINYSIFKKGFIYEGYYSAKKDSTSLQYNFHNPKEFPVKPDSSKSDFILLYKKYIETGSRRSN